MRGRAVARPSYVYTANNDDDAAAGFDDGDDVTIATAYYLFFENLKIWRHFGFELRILTPLPSWID